MSSGYFPLDTYTTEGQQLTLISAQLRDLISKAREKARELDCPEDAASDGEYIGRLDLAQHLIAEAISVPLNPQAEQSCQLDS